MRIQEALEIARVNKGLGKPDCYARRIDDRFTGYAYEWMDDWEDDHSHGYAGYHTEILTPHPQWTKVEFKPDGCPNEIWSVDEKEAMFGADDVTAEWEVCDAEAIKDCSVSEEPAPILIALEDFLGKASVQQEALNQLMPTRIDMGSAEPVILNDKIGL